MISPCLSSSWPSILLTIGAVLLLLPPQGCIAGAAHGRAADDAKVAGWHASGSTRSVELGDCAALGGDE
jgi:hypothetical protein